MFQSRKLLSGLWLASFISACGPMLVEPELTMTASPRTIDGVAQASVIRVIGVDDRARPGTGTVRVTSAAGSLKDGAEVTLAAGEGQVDFTCPRATDPACMGQVRITAEWVVSGKLVNATASVTISPPVIVDAGVDAGTQVTTVTATPRSLGAGTGATSSIVATYVVDGAPSSGSALTLTTTRGQLLEVDGGTFTSPAMTDSAGEVHAILAETGTAGVALLTATGPRGAPATTTVNIEAPDAGIPLDGGTFDGGFFTTEILTLNPPPKTVLLGGTSDSVDLIFTLRTNTQVPVAVVGATVNFSLTAGSFDASMPVTTGSATTDAQGFARTTVHVGTAANGPLLITASSTGAQITVPLTVVRVNSVRFKPDGQTRNQLTIRGVGQSFTSVIFFEVRDAQDMPIPGVRVDFALAPGTAAGCSLSPTSDVSNMQGTVRTTLTAGDSQGSATVLARVLGQPDTPSPGFTIVIGRPSDERLNVSCDRKTLGTLQQSNPPRMDTTTVCRATYSDRNGANPPFDISLSWLTEAGSFGNSTGAANSGFATATYTTGNSLPVPQSPVAGEPSNGANNPRDNVVTIVGSMPGEEHFVDGSGGGVVNGRWDPGEVFVDVGEPYVDRNDNGRHDIGEQHIDVDQYDCTTGMLKPANPAYDGPNGCWDKNTQIWRATHLVYSDSLVNMPSAPFITFNMPLPTLVATGGTVIRSFDWFDPFFNRLDPDGANLSVQTISGSRGTVTVTPRLGGESTGHAIDYVTISATESSLGSTVFTENGPCETTAPDGGVIDAGYPLTRCLRTYRFTGWRTTPSGGSLTIVGGSPQSPLPDGGTPPPTTSVYELRVQNRFQAGPSVYQFQIDFQ